jgi:DNA adenine methylase
MAARLAELKGRFILSLNDVPEVREIFAGFRIVDVPMTYTVRGEVGKDVREVIIMRADTPLPANLPADARCS